MGETGSRLGVVSKSFHLLRGSVPVSLGEVGDALGAIEEARGTTRHKLAMCGRHPNKSQVLAQVGRGSWDGPRGGVHLGAEEEWRRGRLGGCRERRGRCRGRRGRGGSGPGGVPRGSRMQSGVAQRRVRGPLTNLSTLTGPGSTPTKFSTFSSQSKRDRKKT